MLLFSKPVCVRKVVVAAFIKETNFFWDSFKAYSSNWLSYAILMNTKYIYKIKFQDVAATIAQIDSYILIGFLDFTKIHLMWFS